MATPVNLSDTLAAESTNKMTAPSSRNAAWMKAYMETLINPFSTTLKSPKILDGEIKQTAALKLRATGELECSTTGNTNIILFPGLTNVICYCTAPNGDDNSATPNTTPILIDGTVFKNHLSTPNDRAIVRVARLTGAGVRFFLTNSAEEDDGYWEACRVTSHQATNNYVSITDGSGNVGAGIVQALAIDFDLANNSTYQFGQLRDIHKYVFKLNSEDSDHKFSPVSGLNTATDLGNTAASLADLEQWDMIFIKVRGRRNATSPSVLRFDSVANQEVVYSENTPLARLMDETPRDPNIEGYLTYSRVDLPAFQAMN
jgi:hypothetical protein